MERAKGCDRGCGGRGGLRWLGSAALGFDRHAATSVGVAARGIGVMCSTCGTARAARCITVASKATPFAATVGRAASAPRCPLRS